jgi:hypothetical protein
MKYSKRQFSPQQRRSLDAVHVVRAPRWRKRGGIVLSHYINILFYNWDPALALA